MHSPKVSHFCAVKRLLRYVKGTLNHGLHLTSGSLSLTAFTDADWAGDPMDRRSTSGFVVFLGSNPISWCAKKQPTVARSSTEAEYRAMTQTATDLVWIQHLLSELKVPITSPPVLWCDNKSAMALASNPVFHARTKHIEIDYHFMPGQIKFISCHVQCVSLIALFLYNFERQLVFWRDERCQLINPCLLQLANRKSELSEYIRDFTLSL